MGGEGEGGREGGRGEGGGSNMMKEVYIQGEKEEGGMTM